MEVKHCAVATSRTTPAVNIFDVRANVFGVNATDAEQALGNFLTHRELKRIHCVNNYDENSAK